MTKLILLQYLCFSSTFCFCQVDLDTMVQKEVLLKDSSLIKGKKNIILLENDSFIVATCFRRFKSNLKHFIKKYDVDDDKALLKFFKDHPTTSEKVEFDNDLTLMSRLNFRTIDLLKQGNCVVYNKTSRLLERKIIFTKYWKHWWDGERYLTLSGDKIIDVETGAF